MVRESVSARAECFSQSGCIQKALADYKIAVAIQEEEQKMLSSKQANLLI